jgi:hypothetical protein
MPDKIEVKGVFLKNLYWVYLPVFVLMLVSNLGKTECNTTVTFILLIPISMIYTVLINSIYLSKNHREAPFSSKLVTIIFSLVSLWFFGMILLLILAMIGIQLGCNFMG